MSYGKDDEDEDREDRRRRDPFGDMFDIPDMFGFSNFDKEFKKMQKMAEEMMKSNRKRMNKDPFVYGFSVKTGPQGEPKIEEFGNAKDYFYKDEEDKRSEWTPLTDVQEADKEVLVTVDIPGVEKENIDLNVKDKALTVSVDGQRKYRKTIDLPAPVETEEAEATYNNGVLEVKLEKTSEETGESIEIK